MHLQRIDCIHTVVENYEEILTLSSSLMGLSRRSDDTRYGSDTTSANLTNNCVQAYDSLISGGVNMK